MAPLTQDDSELANLRTELQTIEGLLNDVLRRKTMVQSRLAVLEPNGPGCSTPDTSWSSVVKHGRPTVNGRKRSIPLFCPDNSINPIPLANFFSPLARPRDPQATPEPRAISKLALANVSLTPQAHSHEQQASPEPEASEPTVANGMLTTAVNGLSAAVTHLHL